MGRRILVGVLSIALTAILAGYTFSSSTSNRSTQKVPLDNDLPRIVEVSPGTDSWKEFDEPNTFRKRSLPKKEYEFSKIDDFLQAVNQTPWFEAKQELYSDFVEDMNVNPYQCTNGDNQYAFLASGERRNLLRLDGSVIAVHGSVNENCEISDLPGELGDYYARVIVYENYMYRLARNWGVEYELQGEIEKKSLVELTKENEGIISPHFLKDFDRRHKEHGFGLLDLWEEDGVSEHLLETFECIEGVYRGRMSKWGYNVMGCVPF